MKFQRKNFFAQMNGYNAGQLLTILRELTVYTIFRVGYAETLQAVHGAFMKCFGRGR